MGAGPAVFLTMPYPVEPPFSGAAVRIRALVRVLEEAGVRCAVMAPLGEGGDVLTAEKALGAVFRPISSRPRIRHFLNPSLMRESLAAARQGARVFVLGFPYQIFSLWPIAQRYSIPILLDEHNVEWRRFRDLHGRLAGIGMRWVERFAMRRAAAVFCVSTVDQADLHTAYAIHALLAPNGVDTTHFRPEPPDPSLKTRLGIEDNHHVLLFFGPFDYLPNREAAGILRERLLPAILRARPNTTLILAGRNPPALAPHTNLRIAGPVPDMVPYIQLADLILVPLLRGGGSRLKILEAMACGRCVISTPLGASGLDVPADSLVVAELDQFEAAAVRHLTDTGARLAVGAAARQASLTYDWRHALQGLVALVRRYADSSRTTGR